MSRQVIDAPARGVAGSLRATFRQQEMGGVEIVAQTPLELRGPFFETGQCHSYYLRNVTCGVFAGDTYDVSLRTERGVHVDVQSPSANKIHAMPGGRATASLVLEALPDSALIYRPEPTILQADSDFQQETELIVHRDGQLVFSDAIVLGRLASGERLAFRRYDGSLVVRRSGERTPLYHERFVLDPARFRNDIEAALAGYGVLITIVVTGAEEPPASLGGLLPAGPECWAGADALPNGAGFIVRALARSSVWAGMLAGQCAAVLCSVPSRREIFTRP